MEATEAWMERKRGPPGEAGRTQCKALASAGISLLSCEMGACCLLPLSGSTEATPIAGPREPQGPAPVEGIPTHSLPTGAGVGLRGEKERVRARNASLLPPPLSYPAPQCSGDRTMPHGTTTERKEARTPATTWLDLGNTMLRAQSQTPKVTQCVIPPTENFQNRQIHRDREQVVARGRGEGRCGGTTNGCWVSLGRR